MISEYTRVLTQIGSTEVGNIQRLVPPKEDWEYYFWHPSAGIDMREVGENLYELFIVKDPKLDLYQGVFTTFPEINEWTMSDVYSRHPDPSKSGLYTYRGRVDDVVVLNNGEKLTPATMEAILTSDPVVSCAMVVGDHRFQPAALIEPTNGTPEDPQAQEELKKKVIPSLEQVNQHASGHAQLDEYHIMLTSNDRPIVRLGQGKIQRRKTKDQYEKEIDQLYQEVDNDKLDSKIENIPGLTYSDQHSLQQWLQCLFKEMCGLYDLPVDLDIFEAGVDSLQIARMARELRIHSRKAGLDSDTAGSFQPSIFYTKPTINGIADVIFRKANPSVATDLNLDDSLDPAQSMDKLRSRVMQDLPQPQYPPPPENMTVLLTGSTGSLGCYILDTLLVDDRVAKIICLNRSLDAADRHRDTCIALGLNKLSSKPMEFIQGSMNKPDFGITAEKFEYLLKNITHIIRTFMHIIQTNHFVSVLMHHYSRQPMASKLPLVS